MHTGITTALLVHIIYFDFDYAHHGSITMEESWIIRFTLLPRSQPFWIGKAITMAGARVSRLMASRANSSWHSLNGRLINKQRWFIQPVYILCIYDIDFYRKKGILKVLESCDCASHAVSVNNALEWLKIISAFTTNNKEAHNDNTMMTHDVRKVLGHWCLLGVGHVL